MTAAVGASGPFRREQSRLPQYGAVHDDLEEWPPGLESVLDVIGEA